MLERGVNVHNSLFYSFFVDFGDYRGHFRLPKRSLNPGLPFNFFSDPPWRGVHGNFFTSGGIWTSARSCLFLPRTFVQQFGKNVFVALFDVWSKFCAFIFQRIEFAKLRKQTWKFFLILCSIFGFNGPKQKLVLLPQFSTKPTRFCQFFYVSFFGK